MPRRRGKANVLPVVYHPQSGYRITIPRSIGDLLNLRGAWVVLVQEEDGFKLRILPPQPSLQPRPKRADQRN